MTIDPLKGLSYIMGELNEQQVNDLISKYNDGTLLQHERNALDLWYLKYASESESALPAESEEKMSAKLRASLPLQYKKPALKLWPRIVAVAAVLLLLASAAFWFMKDPLDNKPVQYKYSSDVAPGGTGATLTLASGKKIRISAEQVGKLAVESGVKISKTAEGQIFYEITGSQNDTEGQTNVLETSAGEQVQVRLPDGTVIHLNASSYLKYPASFNKSAQRRVEFTGEGFFEVAKDKSHPFIVKTAGQEVEVLGTQFNINSYADEPAIKTTLIEGSVKISNEAKLSKILVPGQQASVSGQEIILENVETEYAIAWTKGYFMFNNETLETIMSKLSRWYKVEAVYRDPELKDRRFFGSIGKFENISKILSVMQRTNVASFDIQDNKIIINKK